MSDKNTVFQIINERILGALDLGVVPWRKPWAGASNAPRALDGGRRYSGINAFYLAIQGFEDPRFLTAKKAMDLGGSVIKGEKGFPVVFWKQLRIKQADADTGIEKIKRIPLLRYFTVFNVSQVEGVEFKPIALTVAPDPIEAAEAIVSGMPNPPKIDHRGGDRAFYRPMADHISLPPRKSFKSSEGYYETAFHELGHSTGHKSRLDREGIEGFDHFGSGQYAREELVAEFAAGFLMGEAGIEAGSIANIAAYIANWKQVIADDPKALVVAAGRGEKAARYILGRLEAETLPEQELEVAA